MTDGPVSEADFRRANCWFDVDRVVGDPASTAWKRHARWRQAIWRQARGFPVGAHPYRGGDASAVVGSRMALDFAMSTGANFLTPGALAATRKRLSNPEPHQMLSAERLWADLLSSMPLCFNLFGDLDGDSAAAARAVNAWWPAAPVGQVTVRFEHSPGRRDPTLLANRSAFDVAFEIETGDRTRAIIGVETKYHEHAKREPRPRDAVLQHYIEVTGQSGEFREGWQAALIGTELQQIWLDHLLVLAMVQHPSRRWSWGRFVLVYPAENPSFARAVTAYRSVLREAAQTFEFRTIEGLLATPAALPVAVRAEFEGRYLVATVGG
jgi:hypothetical protein